MTPPIRSEPAPDVDLWQLVLQGNTPAFEALVRRHQSAVSAVAYNACGDLALSEDVAQETFWTAWRQRAALAEPSRLRAWLCGIARNLGKNVRRRAMRGGTPAALDVATELSAGIPDPAEAAVSREEEALVWQTLAEIPESYREPLILFYREEQSVAEVAAALDLSEDAVKQRLSRGRSMLRERVAQLVEGTLRRSRPGKGLTVAVMAGLTTLTAGAKTALAGTTTGVASTALKSAAGVGVAGGVLGGIAGSLGGLFGSWLGTWLPAQLAPSRREREFLLRSGRRMLLVSVAFTILLVAPTLVLGGQFHWLAYLVFWAAWMAAFGIYVTLESILGARAVRRIRAEPAGEPNDSPLRAGWNAMTLRTRGRVYRSRASLWGLPLVDINVGDPRGGRQDDEPPSGGRRIARGWIAIGDDARGALLAVGGKARGFVAIGGVAIGVVSFGGLALGFIAVGGLAVGALAVGGLGAGGLAFGGLAVGWQAAGGGAIAYDVACGGGAIAYHAALGGAAIASDHAVGGAAIAEHANDAAAMAVLLDHPLKRSMDWYLANTTAVTTLVVLLSVGVPCLMLPLMYRRERGDEERTGSGLLDLRRASDASPQRKF